MALEKDSGGNTATQASATENLWDDLDLIRNADNIGIGISILDTDEHSCQDPGSRSPAP